MFDCPMLTSILRLPIEISHMRRLPLVLVLFVAACRGPQPSQPAVQQTAPSSSQAAPADEAKQLEAKTARFAPVDLTADISKLPDNERQALKRLVQAAKVFDTLFLRQVWAGNEPMLLDLTRDTSPLGRARVRGFVLNKGPWPRLDGNQPFTPGVPAKPEQANFYPAGATKQDVDAWLKTLP